MDTALLILYLLLFLIAQAVGATYLLYVFFKWVGSRGK